MIVQHRIGDSAHHPVQPQIVHRKESAIEEDECESEMNLAPSLIHHAAKHFWKPEVNRPENAEKASAEQHIVNMRNNEVSVVDEEIDRNLHGCDPGRSLHPPHLLHCCAYSLCVVRRKPFRRFWGDLLLVSKNVWPHDE